MRIEIDAQNIKCGGCVNAIKTGLGTDPRVQSVEVDIPTGHVSVEAEGDIRAALETKLAELGYPARP